MKAPASFFAFVLIYTCSFAQQQTYDVLSYNLPEGWQQKDANGGRQLTFADSITGDYATILLVQSVGSNASARQHFHHYWKEIVQPSVKISGDPAMEDPVHAKGWEIISGHAGYIEGNRTGMAILLAATGAGKTTAVVLMSNTSKYQHQLNTFINALEITQPATTQPAISNNITGLWADYAVEKNAYQQYTTGYLRKEYQFNADGTYTFRKKNFLTSSSEIYFVMETGRYTVNGNQLIITPTQGKAGFWAKANSLKNNEWGSFVKMASYNLEKLSYTFEILEDPGYGNTIILKPGKATARDGGGFNAQDDPYKFHYAFRKPGSLIDNPPAWKK